MDGSPVTKCLGLNIKYIHKHSQSILMSITPDGLFLRQKEEGRHFHHFPFPHSKVMLYFINKNLLTSGSSGRDKTCAAYP